jgi:dTDP-4-amino-4,6-dideoxygalactose transaminase
MEFLPFTRPQIDEATIAGVADVLRSGWITSGPQVKALEAELSRLCAGRAVRTFSSGTAALEVALRLAGIGPGDEVITTPLSWVATANVVLEVGARPVFVDVDPRTRNIDLSQAEKAVSPSTRAIIPVDLAGLPVDRERLYSLAKEKKLRVIEDACQSFGANWRGRMLGSFGDLVAFSFHANKNVTSAEGGALVLPDEGLAPLCEKLRLQGVVRSGEDGMEVDVLGGKCNLTDVAARLALGQLAHLQRFTERRRALARRYFALWDRSLGGELPPEDFAQSNWHMFQVALPSQVERSSFMKEMRAAGIGTGVHYPAMHLFKLYRRLGWHEGQFPQAERLGRSLVTLPLFPSMRDEDVDRVCASAKQILEKW